MPPTKTPLSDELQQRIEEIAAEQNRPAGEVLEEAVRSYLDDRSWTKVLGYGRKRAQALGMTEADIDRAIAETRSEQHER